MPRIDIDVPYDEKDEAKQLGAKYDFTQRVWYIPDGVDPFPFRKWFPIRRILALETTVHAFIEMIGKNYETNLDAIEDLVRRMNDLQYHMNQINRELLLDSLGRTSEQNDVNQRLEKLETICQILISKIPVDL